MNCVKKKNVSVSKKVTLQGFSYLKIICALSSYENIIMNISEMVRLLKCVLFIRQVHFQSVIFSLYQSIS